MMMFRGKLQEAAFLLMTVMKAVSADSPACGPSEYEIRNGCCSMCPPGSQVKRDCTEDTRTSCQACIHGSYMDKPNGLKQCAPCSICDPGLGLVLKQSCTAASDTVCEPAEGFFCMDSTKSSCAAAQKHSSCKPGQYISKQGTSSSDTECSDCSDGTFSDGSSPSCRPHRQCGSENLLQIKAGTSSSDAECGKQTPRAAVAIVVVLLLLLGVMVGLLLFFIKKKLSLKRDKQRSEAHPTEEANGLNAELKHLNGEQIRADPESPPPQTAAGPACI